MQSVLDDFIVLEGLDGCGKSTQESMLISELEKRGHDVLKMAEPTDYEIGSLVRRVLRREICTTPKALALLYAADREHHLHMEGGILESIKAGRIVVQSRYLYSSIAYQSVEVDYDYVKAINNFPHPKVVIFIDLDPALCLERIERRGEGKELFDRLEFLSAVRSNFLRCFSSLPEGVEYLQVDGRGEAQELANKILDFTLRYV